MKGCTWAQKVDIFGIERRGGNNLENTLEVSAHKIDNLLAAKIIDDVLGYGSISMLKVLSNMVNFHSGYAHVQESRCLFFNKDVPCVLQALLLELCNEGKKGM